MFTVFFLVFVLLVSTSEPVGAVHKWIDDTGTVHYGDHPPTGKTGEVIRTQPPPTEETLQRARERSERTQERLRELEREAPAGAQSEPFANTAPSPFPRSVPLQSIRHFRCGRGGLVTIGDTVDTLLEKCGPPQGEYVVKHPVSMTYPRSRWGDEDDYDYDYEEYELVTFWRYASYGKFPCRVIIRDNIVRQLELELVR